MKKLVALAAFALLVTAGGAYAQDKMAKPAKAPATKDATGTVKAVTADSVIVTDKAGKDWTFTVDAKTMVQAKGAGTKTAKAQAAGKAGISISEAVKAGDRVTIKFHDMGATLHAASVKVM